VIQPTTTTNRLTTTTTSSTTTTIVLPFPTTTTLPLCFQAPESIASNFNGTSVAKNAFIWFNSVLSVHGPHPADFTVRCDDSTIDFVAGGERYVLDVPSASVAFSSSATVATTEFNAASNEWETVIPSSAPAGNAFLTGLGFQVPVDFPGGIKPVTWTCRFSSDAPGVMVSWKWSAAVYTDFSRDPNALGVKPVDGGRRSAHGHSDHAGTPETFRASVIGGARGGGGSNFTGGYSGTRAVKCPLCQDDHVPSALNRRIRKARMLSARVARTGSGRQAEKLQTRLARSLGGIGRLISRAEAVGRISPSCARALQKVLQGMVVDARVCAG